MYRFSGLHVHGVYLPIGKGRRDLFPGCNLPLFCVYYFDRLARRFDRAHSKALGAPVLPELTTFTWAGAI